MVPNEISIKVINVHECTHMREGTHTHRVYSNGNQIASERIVQCTHIL